jgi:hypothetical protein
MRNLAFITLLAVMTTGMSAQRMLSPAPPFAAPQLPGAGTGSPVSFRAGSGHAARIVYPLGLFSDSFYSNALYSTGYPVAAQPPVIIVQNPPAAAATSDRIPAPAQPLMIELRGDQYVRISGEDNSGAQMIDHEHIQTAKLSRRERQSGEAAVQPAAAHDLAPVVLVFRDGHREQISTYTITSGILYTAGDYYTNGSWNKKIELSSLNIPETIASNRSQGVSFQLPTAPNEVIVRP